MSFRALLVALLLTSSATAGPRIVGYSARPSQARLAGADKAPFKPSIDPKLHGRWVLVACSDDRGKELTGEEAAKSMTCRIDKKGFLVNKEGTPIRLIVRCYPKKTPHEIDFYEAEDRETNHGIYAITGKKLIICVSNKWGKNKASERPRSLKLKDAKNKNLKGLMRFEFQRME